MATTETFSVSKAAEPKPVRVGEINGVAVGREEEAVPAPPPAGKKWAKEILTKEEVDHALSFPDYDRDSPFLTLTEEHYSAMKSLKGLEFSEMLREHFARCAEVYHSLRQAVLCAREIMRRQLKDKGYVERFVLVDATDDDVPPPVGGGGATGDDITTHRPQGEAVINI